MWRHSILCRGAFRPLFLWLFIIPFALRSSAQCSGTTGTQTYTYNLTNASGNYYTISVPQFNNVAGYTLESVNYSSWGMTTGTLELDNSNLNTVFEQPGITRSDFVQLGGSAVAYMSGQTYDYPPVVLNSATPGSPNVPYVYTYPSTTLYSNQQLLNYNITNPATLLSTYTGSGNLTMYYSAQFFYDYIGSGVAATLTASDQLTFTVTYTYCNTTLAADFMTFTATRQGASQVLLSWSVGNEEPGRLYYIEVSTDGTNFTDVGSEPSNALSSNASYNYTYTTPDGATGKLYFRIKQVDERGGISYSSICVVNLDNGVNSNFSIFPNPAVSGNYICLNLPGDNKTWQVEIFAADGSLVQKNAFTNLSLVTVNFTSPMAAGTYFVRAVNPSSGDMHTGSFVVRK